MRILRLTDSIFEENAYIVLRDDDVTIIDPGFGYKKLVEYFDKNDLTPSRIFLTHGHIDHIHDLDKLIKKYPNVPIYIHDLDSDFLFDESLNCSAHFGEAKVFPTSLDINIIKDKQVSIDGFTIYHTPGHTRGSVVIRIHDTLFTGDTLFKGSVGRIDLPTGNDAKLKESLEYIKKSFPKNIKIYPGHFDMTTLDAEIKQNPYLIKKHKGLFRK